MLDVLGYGGNGDKTGAMAKVSKQYNVPPATLRGWWLNEHNPPPTEIRDIKTSEIIALIKNEVHGALTSMPNARPDASYKDLAVAGAVLIDKLQLLEGKATERIEHISPEQRADRIRELFDIARDRRDQQAASH